MKRQPSFPCTKPCELNAGGKCRGTMMLCPKCGLVLGPCQIMGSADGTMVCPFCTSPLEVYAIYLPKTPSRSVYSEVIH